MFWLVIRWLPIPQLSPILSYLVMIRGICCCALSTTGYEAYHYGVSIFAYMYVMFLGNLGSSLMNANAQYS